MKSKSLQRVNFSFDQFINMLRENERNFIICLLDENYTKAIEEQDFEAARVIRDQINGIVESANRPASQVKSNKEGVPE